MTFGLKEDVIVKVNSVFADFSQINKAVIYGSRAKGNFRNGSDIDITLEGNDLNLNILNSVSSRIDDLLLPYTFDLSIFKQIDNPDLIDHIHRIGKVFYEKS